MIAFAGTGPLTRMIARRDRVRIAVWVLSIVATVVVSAASTIGLYPTQADLDKAAEASRDNPAALAFSGPDVALDTIGGQVAFQVGAFGLTLAGLMSLLMVSRLTRGEEDSGRLELVRAMPVGRHAPIAAAVWVVAAMNVAVGALVAVSLIALELPTMGSLVLGASFTALGLFFIGVTLVAAQVTENPRVVSGIAGGVLGLSFVVRAIGDVGDGTLSWFSPIGLAQKSRPYGGDVWWPLLLCVALAVGLAAIGAALASRRDFGAGLIAAEGGARIRRSLAGNPARAGGETAAWRRVVVGGRRLPGGRRVRIDRREHRGLHCRQRGARGHRRSSRCGHCRRRLPRDDASDPRVARGRMRSASRATAAVRGERAARGTGAVDPHLAVALGGEPPRGRIRRNRARARRRWVWRRG